MYFCIFFITFSIVRTCTILMNSDGLGGYGAPYTTVDFTGATTITLVRKPVITITGLTETIMRGRVIPLARVLSTPLLGKAAIKITSNCGGSFAGTGGTVGTNSISFVYDSTIVADSSSPFTFTAPVTDIYTGTCSFTVAAQKVETFEDYNFISYTANMPWELVAQAVFDVTGLVTPVYTGQELTAAVKVTKSMGFNGNTYFSLTPGTGITNLFVGGAGGTTTFGPYTYTAPSTASSGAGSTSVTGVLTQYSISGGYQWVDWTINGGAINTAYPITVKNRPVFEISLLQPVVYVTQTIPIQVKRFFDIIGLLLISLSPTAGTSTLKKAQSGGVATGSISTWSYTAPATIGTGTATLTVTFDQVAPYIDYLYATWDLCTVPGCNAPEKVPYSMTVRALPAAVTHSVTPAIPTVTPSYTITINRPAVATNNWITPSMTLKLTATAGKFGPNSGAGTTVAADGLSISTTYITGATYPANTIYFIAPDSTGVPVKITATYISSTGNDQLYSTCAFTGATSAGTSGKTTCEYTFST
jgi:hypothetical protein